MSDGALEYWTDWRNRLILELRRQDVSGATIGDIVLEAESHVSESGESPHSAFGDPSEYARLRASMLPARQGEVGGSGMSWWLICLSVVGGLGGILDASGAWNIGAGEATAGGIFPAWSLLLAGGFLMMVPLYLIGTDLVTDPRTGRPLLSERWSRNHILIIAVGFVPLMVIALIARVLDR